MAHTATITDEVEFERLKYGRRNVLGDAAGLALLYMPSTITALSPLTSRPPTGLRARQGPHSTPCHAPLCYLVPRSPPRTRAHARRVAVLVNASRGADPVAGYKRRLCASGEHTRSAPTYDIPRMSSLVLLRYLRSLLSIAALTQLYIKLSGNRRGNEKFHISCAPLMTNAVYKRTYFPNPSSEPSHTGVVGRSGQFTSGDS
jgi:hypothetical protein